MPSLESLSTFQKIMALNWCPSGGGKTGALGSLANAGYKLRVLDFDQGCQILTDPSVVKPEFRKNVVIHSCIDNYGTGILPSDSKSEGAQKGLTGPIVLGVPVAFSNAMKLLNHWKTKTEDLGPVTSWGRDTILVIDTLTFMSKSALNQASAMAGRINQRPSQSEWGVAQNMVESCLELLHSRAVQCHVIVNAHITYINKPGEKREFKTMGQGEMEMTEQIAYPYCLGKALPPKIESFFNLAVTMTGNTQKKIEVAGIFDGVRTKNPMPGKLKLPVPIETGWATIFSILTGVENPSTISVEASQAAS